MHQSARDFIARFASTNPYAVIEIGSRDINGGVRDLFPNAKWTGLDLYPGKGVDVVCNAADWKPHDLCDLCVCCEVMEHAPNWRELIAAAFRFLKSPGALLITCAGPGRKPHSAIDGSRELHPDEHYENLSASDVASCCQDVGFQVQSALSFRNDTYVAATK